MPIHWVVNRLRVRQKTAIPLAYLLRQVFETCGTYEEVRNMLVHTPLCIPVIFTLTGPKPEQGCIIERREDDYRLHKERIAAAANHWISADFKGRDRRIQSRVRRARMLENLPSFDDIFDWLAAPVLNSHTRLAVEMNVAKGSLRLQGWHGPKPQTRIFEMMTS